MNLNHLQNLTDEEIVNHYEHDESMVVRDLCRRLSEICDERDMHIEDAADDDAQLGLELDFAHDT